MESIVRESSPEAKNIIDNQENNNNDVQARGRWEIHNQIKGNGVNVENYDVQQKQDEKEGDRSTKSQVIGLEILSPINKKLDGPNDKRDKGETDGPVKEIPVKVGNDPMRKEDEPRTDNKESQKLQSFNVGEMD
ncbi:hypothetical protein L2E82_01149 [Cichorium intybus]|uniref:Uncharacterized protein n=1 Tax=Cichorium intybus TaxID=13427 RepID=A0ACB9GY05_CICIN|nr:hypothetical protein L2E82_01149 [Cichorium intybus]